MRLVEFEEKYPKYSLGFLADNEETETEKLVGYRMRILFRKGKSYQSFSIPKEDYEEAIKCLHKCKPNCAVEMRLNDATFHIFLIDNAIIGYCLETKERIAIDDFWVTRFIIEDTPNREAFWHQAMK